MLPFENIVADYIDETSNHVLYRSTPLFEGDNLLATGVLMEGWSVEDNGDGICFNVFCYNVQPGITIDRTSGNSYQEESIETIEPQRNGFIANKNSRIFHMPDCPSVKRMNEANKTYFEGTRDELLSQGFSPCSNCNP